jgi:transcriptional regulator with XRE-family HTH domain/predicted HTH domain antitoxin
MAIHDRLRYARSRAGLTLEHVEQRSGIGASSLSEFETGKREPRLSQLQALADVYRKSIGFFLEEGAVAEDTVLWREKPSSPSAGEIEAEFLRLCEQYHNLEVWCAEDRGYALPEAKGDRAAFTYGEAEELARQIRIDLQLGDRPGHALLQVLEEVCRVKVFHLPFEPSGCVASTVSETFGAGVLLNAKNVRWRRNFDLAHELFHLLTWRMFGREQRGGLVVANEREEKLATCFATHVLMPTEVTQQAINKVMEGNKVSFRALLLWRMKYLYNRREGETEKDIERYRTIAGMFEREKGDGPATRPARFEALAVRALNEGEISQGRFAEYMGISRREALRFVEQAGVADGEVAIPAA